VALAASAECSVMVLETRAGNERRWPANTTQPDLRALALARFTLAPGGSLEFGFHGGGIMSPHSDILLQLAADAVDSALARLSVHEAQNSRNLTPATPAARASDARSLLATR
jgi:hypothetical protein